MNRKSTSLPLFWTRRRFVSGLLCFIVAYGVCAAHAPAQQQQKKPASKPAKKTVPASAKKTVARPAAMPKRGQPFTEKLAGTLVTFDMVPVPGGTLPGANTKVKPFWIAKTETTWDAYDVFMLRLDATPGQKNQAADAISRPSKPYGAPDRGFGHQGYPAISLTFQGAQEYCRWLSAKTGKKYRLPTEAEWELAARAGMTGAISREELDKQGWHWDNAGDKTQPVATKAANAYGIHDLLGNAGEWCVGKEKQPVLCGGSFNDGAAKVGFATRATYSPDWQATDPQQPKSRWWLSDGPFAGFRVVCEE